MADFRKSLLLAAVALAVGVGTASAQTAPACSSVASGVPPLLRDQGLTELTGLISITCPALGQTTLDVNFLVQENSKYVTSLLGEPFLTLAGGLTYTGTVLVGPGGTANVVAFNGVVLPPNAPFTFSIGGIRINATSASLPTSGTSGIFGAATATISVTNGNVPITPAYTVGYVVPNAITQSIVPAAVPGASACSAAPSTITASTGVFASIVIAENPLDPDAFKPQAPTANSADSESGLGLSGNPLIGATSGTQFAIGYNIPSGLTFYAPITIQSTNYTVAGATPGSGLGTINLVTGSGSTIVAASNAVLPDGVTPAVALTGAGILYYNVVLSDASLIEEYVIDLYPGGTISSAETAALATLAPYGPVPPTNPTIIPSFNPTIPTNIPAAGSVSTTPDGYIALLGTGSQAPCQTTLLFPFMTNQAGFDTGFSIAYTATDPFGTTAVTNANAAPSCTLYFYGDGAPVIPAGSAPTALTIAAGFSELHDTVSAVAPGFQGYMMAVCNFIYAHGYAFITDGFMGTGRGLSEGYLGLVVPDGQRASIPSTGLGFTGQPEILSH